MKELLLFTAGIVLLTARITAQQYLVVMDNESPAFDVRGEAWQLDKTGEYHDYYRYSAAGPGRGDTRVVWTIDAIPAGRYLVEFYVDRGDYAEGAEYIVESADGVTSVVRSQHNLEEGWHELGTFRFDHAGRITQTDHWTGAGTKVIADALRLTLEGSPQCPTLNVVPPAITIVVDDLGNLDPADPQTDTRRLFDAAPDFTYAVIPDLPYTTHVLEMARERNIETILHQPMEYHGGRGPRAGSTELRNAMDDAMVRGLLRRNLDLMKGFVVGVNNHTGSIFSQNERGLEVVMGELTTRSLIFYDSRTISDSLGYDIAKKYGLPTGERDLFLDSRDSTRTEQLVMSMAQRALYAPNYQHLCISHQGSRTVDGMIASLPRLKEAGVAVKRLSLAVAQIVEADFQPVGSTFRATGNWRKSDSDMMSTECRDGWAGESGDAGAVATFSVTLQRPGAYNVFVGWTGGENNCAEVTVGVAGADKTQERVISQRDEAGRWHFVGTYSFEREAKVTLSRAKCRDKNHVMKADCIKLVAAQPASPR